MGKVCDFSKCGKKSKNAPANKATVGRLSVSNLINIDPASTLVSSYTKKIK